MGGWISVKMALTQPGDIAAMLLIAPSLNFMRAKYKLLYDSFDPKVRQELDSGATVIQPTPYGNMPCARRFAEEAIEVEVDTSKPLDIKCPVRILHGMRDEVVPYEVGVGLAKLIG